MIYNVVEERAKTRKGSYTRPPIVLLHSLHVVHRSNPKWCVTDAVREWDTQDP